MAAHVEKLLKLPNCSNDQASSLHFLYDKVMVHTQGLSSLGVKIQQYGSVLIPVLMSKLPPDVRICMASEQEEDIWDINELMKTIQREVEARESSEGTHFNFTKPRRNPLPSQGYSASSLTAQNQLIKYVYCTGSHFSASYPTIKEIKEAILMRSGRCFNCLKSNHQAKDCDCTRNVVSVNTGIINLSVRHNQLRSNPHPLLEHHCQH